MEPESKKYNQIMVKMYETVSYFIEDVESSDRLTIVKDSQFNRRQYVRSLCAFIEATIWQYKQCCLKLTKLVNMPSLTTIEKAFLDDEEVKLNDKGDFSTSRINIPLSRNLLATANVLNKMLHTTIEPKSDNAGWESFVKLNRVRNTLMHPKSKADFEVDDDAMKYARTTFMWLVEEFHKKVFDSSVEIKSK